MGKKSIVTSKIKAIYVRLEKESREKADLFLADCEAIIQSICKSYSTGSRTAVLTNMFHYLDTILYPEWEKEIPVRNRDLSLRCGKNSPCNQCCYIWVCTFDPEIDLIMEVISQIPGFLKHLDWNRIEQQSQATDPKSFYALDPDIRKCIFNSSSGRCQIHSVRPFACRQYFIAESGAACGLPDDLKEPVHEIPCLEGELVAAAYIRMFVNIDAPEKNLSQQLMEYKPK
jgi:Fe-S-cluster containining protein